VAIAAEVRLDTLRKIERGVVASPNFFFVAAVALELGLSLDDVARESSAVEA
jgi:UDP-N-acetylmuramyl pentapeptide synthase